MIKLVLSSLVILVSFSASAQLGTDFKLPNEWTKDFTISISHHGSMNGGFTDLRITYDSCIYKSGSNQSKPVKRIYVMKEADRVAILKKLNELKADQIKSESGIHVVHDGWSQSICFGGFNCIEGGTSAEMSDEDKNAFLDAYRYLEEFGMKKKK